MNVYKPVKFKIIVHGVHLSIIHNRLKVKQPKWPSADGELANMDISIQ